MDLDAREASALWDMFSVFVGWSFLSPEAVEVLESLEHRMERLRDEAEARRANREAREVDHGQD